jgi:hypothetical protein
MPERTGRPIVGAGDGQRCAQPDRLVHAQTAGSIGVLGSGADREPAWRP